MSQALDPVTQRHMESLTDACPVYPGKKYEDRDLDDPADQDLPTVRRIRDEIDARVGRLVGELVPD